MKILLLEDDIILKEITQENLQENGFEVTSCEDGYEAEELIYELHFDLLLLDVNVPNLNGFELLRSIREKDITTPVIFITSLNTSNDMEEGFNAGADDYIRKPFEIKELLLRINNIKRIYNIESQKLINISEFISFDTISNTIINKNDMFHLTKKEAQVLHYLYNHTNKNISIDELITNIWSYDSTPNHSTIRTYIKKIRKYIGEEYISNIKGVGYKFNKI